MSITIDWIRKVIRDVSELPGRDSPEDWPEAMLVTAGELRGILESAEHKELETMRAQLAEKDAALNFLRGPFGEVIATAKEVERLKAERDELVRTLQSTLDWLSSYPGGGAIKVYHAVRVAIAKVQK
jgi:hypothetical protein